MLAVQFPEHLTPGLPSKNNMKTDLYNLSGEKIRDLNLSKSVFDVKINEVLVSQAIRVLQSRSRSAHAKTKHRGEIAGTNRKIWAQKGTDRARHSTAKAPQFVGGGSAHGPRGDQNFKLKLTKRMKIVALNSVLSKFATNKSMLAVEKFSSITPKTKIAWDFIDKLGKENSLLAGSRQIGIITTKTLPSIKRAFRNIPGFTLLSLSSLNPHNLSSQNFLIFSKKAINKLK
ncbi:50S ribosomal protein L4 [Candidatus Shapirobacteria bacterium CG_4_10_14_0_2_um_filter_40_12]|uniref:Large ribosomal subunit protein uL4 n=1 Tax=Candidatus Shapirobacteria bacterium CG_4_10_14_0_2_um_filter_40_12 TaxID=1974871 RepID=A0A2M7TSZ2_9BACT|nr:MAG: 50S ribosomal protein L4 [Candidatus Shapirobacteria bacterium CG_4_10_14_0_2_um_filter_40_12]